MRSLKFRAWAPHYGMVIIDDLYWFEENGVHDASNDDEFKVMQFTGLLDRNGREIYEGDILQLNGTNGKVGRSAVTYEDGCFGITDFRFLPIGRPQGNYKGNSDGWTIIGNIYENSELLEVQK